MNRLYLLGRVDLRDANGTELRSVLAQPKRFALLAYLALNQANGPWRRDSLVALFWPEVSQGHARKSLNKAVHFLRHAIGEGALVSRTTEDLSVDPDRLWCDAAALAESVRAGRSEEALELYHGDLLPGFYLDGVPGFEEWLEHQRAILRRLTADAARRLAEERERAAQITLAVGFARRAVELSGDERSVRHLLELLDRLGDRAAALQEYNKFARRLASEFEAEPAAETKQLVLRIRAREGARGDVMTAATSPPDSALLANSHDIEHEVGGSAVATASATTETVSSLASSPSTRPGLNVPRLAVLWLLGGVAAVATAVVAFVISSRPPSASRSGHRQLTRIGNAGVPRISPTGSYFSFHTFGPNQSLFVQPRSGGSAVKVADRVLALTVWMPSGEDLLINRPAVAPTDTVVAVDGSTRYRNVLEFLRIPRSGGTPRHIAQADHASVSRDGRRMVLTAFERPEQFSVVDLPSGRVTDVIPAPGLGVIWDLAWSPSGEFIAALTADIMGDPRTRVALVSVAAKRITVLPRVIIGAPPRLVYGPSDSVLYISQGPGPATQIVRITLDPEHRRETKPPQVLLSGFEIRSFDVSWDGQIAVYARVQRESRLDLLTFTRDSTREPTTRQLRASTSESTIPTFAPDGATMAYVETHLGKDVYLLHPAGGPPQRLTFLEADEISTLSWSPSGRRLAFIAVVKPGPDPMGTLMLTDLVTRSTRRLGTRALVRTIGVPNRLAWANDSLVLYFPVDSINPIARFGVDGEELHGFDVVRSADTVLLPRERAVFGDARFHVPLLSSPAGDEVAFAGLIPSQGLGNQPAIEALSLSTGKLRVLVDSVTMNAGPDRSRRHWRGIGTPVSWSLDGMVYFENPNTAQQLGTPNGERRSLWRVRLNDGAVEFVSWLPWDCRLTSVSRNGTQGLCVRTQDHTDIWEMRGFDPSARSP